MPPLGSVIIAMFKNSAVVGAFGVGGDLFSVGRDLDQRAGLRHLPVLTGVAIGYLMITLPAGRAARRSSSGRWRSRDERQTSSTTPRARRPAGGP